MVASVARTAVSMSGSVFEDEARSHARSHARSRSPFVGCEWKEGGVTSAFVITSLFLVSEGGEERARTSMGQPYALAELTWWQSSQSSGASSCFVNHIAPRDVSNPARSNIFCRCPEDASRYARCEKGHVPRVGDAAAAALMRVSSMTAAVIA